MYTLCRFFIRYKVCPLINTGLFKLQLIVFFSFYTGYVIDNGYSTPTGLIFSSFPYPDASHRAIDIFPFQGK